MTSLYRSDSCIGDSSSKHAMCAVDRCGEPVNLLERVVNGERGARGRRDFEKLHDRHRAVMPCPDRDAVLVEDRSEVMGMHARDDEGDETRLVTGGTDDSKAVDGAEPRRRVVQQLGLMALRGIA